MCGIIAVVRRPSLRQPPGAAEVLDRLEAASQSLGGVVASQSVVVAPISDAAKAVAAADQLLGGVAGVRALLEAPGLRASIVTLIDGLARQIVELENRLDSDANGHVALVGVELERLNAAVVNLKDAVWAVQRDRLRAAAGVAGLLDGVSTAGEPFHPAAVAVALSIHQALSALDRLEVRGRDSAGLHLLVRNHGIDLQSPAISAVIADRAADPLFGSMAVRTPEGHLSFVYKAAAEIGELGDNTRALRSAIVGDPLLRHALGAASVEAVVLGHTRWASVGIISQPNAHPLNSDETDDNSGAYVTAVLNGDVDNFADLKAAQALHIADEITTDAKVIPTLTSRAMADGTGVLEAFRSTVNELEGSVAIAASAADAADSLLLALRGSGQALYIGLAEDSFIVASEPYGVVEETVSYLRLDGDIAVDPANPASSGQVVRLVGSKAGDRDGIERWAYDGTPIPVVVEDLAEAQITTRDIDRGDSPHFLLKEIGEAPGSFRKTLRGKLVDIDGHADVTLGDDVLSPALRGALADGSIKRILAIGQGTAAVAARALLEGLAAFAPTTEVRVEAVL
ncbi:MAG: glucosamine-6-phosphate synthase, partial [Actinobacteria bacterium]|nr:glucosamine-6-phosphate synthase [Actinomycetota bacterium]